MSETPRKVTDEEMNAMAAILDHTANLTLAQIARLIPARLAFLESLLTEVAEKVAPVETDDMSWHGDAFRCRWCGVGWGVEKQRGYTLSDYLHEAVHPQNNCLYVRLRQAVQP